MKDNLYRKSCFTDVINIKSVNNTNFHLQRAKV